MQRLAFVALFALLGGCQFLPGNDAPTATPPPTSTPTAIVEPTLDVPTPEVSPEATPEATPVETETAMSRNTPVVMETPEKTPRPRATRETSFTEETPLPLKTPRPTATPKPTKIASATPEPVVETELVMETPEATPLPQATAEAIVEATPEEEVAVTAEMKVASLTFSPGAAASLVKIDATTTGAQSIVRVEVSAAATYKILALANRRQVWIDFEELALAEPKTVTGSGASLVKEISAKSFERGLVRVVIQLKDDGKPFPVIGPKKKTGQSTNVEVKIGPDPDPP